MPAATAAVRDFRDLPADVRGCTCDSAGLPAAACGGVTGGEGLPYRGAGLGEGPDGQERGDRAGGFQGGFVVKNPPPMSNQEAFMAEGIACYKMFISGLLDLTDNLVDGKVVAPPQLFRRDEDDTYLVVAADKGTASFSDIANAVAQEYGFWLGDAFASGGSVGYDHKAMGITARGAWSR